MAKLEKVNKFTTLKQQSDVDLANGGKIVFAKQEFVSTAGQTVIIFTNFSINLDNKEAFMLFIDGIGPLVETDDYNFTNIQNNQSSEITLTAPISAGLNIVGMKLGIKQEQFPNPSSVTATLNNDVAQPFPWAEKGFCPFVCEELLTAIDGAPSSTQFRSDIEGRADIRAAKLNSVIGIERIRTNSLHLLDKEFGPDGHIVQESDKKDERIRFVGPDWAEYTTVTTDGTAPALLSTGASANPENYVEIVFYGTGLDFLTRNGGGTNIFDIELDGSSSGTVDIAGSNIISSRSYNGNVIHNLVSGLALGWHTVKLLAKVGNTNVFLIFGFQVRNDLTQLRINDGTGFYSTKEEVLASASVTDYDNGIVGARGARVVKFLKDAAVDKVIQEVNPSQADLTSADHANEEIIRTINFREFGSNRVDDFSTLAGGPADTAFTLDDGTTTLIGNDAGVSAYQGREVVVPSSTSAFLSLHFVGSGLDIEWATGAVAFTDDYTVTIDGVIADATWVPDQDTFRNYSFVSGLPYGSHIVTIQRNGGGSLQAGIFNMHIYAPKKPTLPDGAIELVDYNVLADFDDSGATGTALVDNHEIPVGTLRKNALREFAYTGTWTVSSISSFETGFVVFTTTATSTAKYTFWGTGVNIHLIGASGASFDIKVDDVLTAGGTNLINVTDNTGGNYSGSGTTGVPWRLTFSGLSLGFHTIELEQSNATATDMVAYNIITPVHINNTKIGNLSLSDSRIFSPLAVESKKVDLKEAKAWINYDGDTNEILGSHNIAATIDVTTATYRIYFEKSFKDEKYVVVGMAKADGAESILVQIDEGTANKTKNSITIEVRQANTNSLADRSFNLVFYGELENEEEL